MSEGRRSLRALVGVVAGASAATFVAAFFAWAAGALSPAVGTMALLGGVAVGLLAGRPALSPAEGDLAGAPRWSRLEWLAVALFAVAAIRQFGWIVFERHGRLLTLLPYDYGDLPLHWTYVEFLARGAAFWPQDPILTGDRLSYPLGVDLLTAVFVQLGLSLRLVLPAMGLAGSAMAALSLRRWGGALAVAGFLFAGGLSGFQVLWTGRLLDYQSSVAWKNLFLALFVPQRGFLLALPAGLLLLWSGRERLLRDRAGLPAWVDGVLWGALPLVHLHTFLLVSLLLGTWALAARRVRAALPALGVALAPATWGVVEVTGGFGAASLVGWAPGWVVGSENPALFLLVNFGLFLPLAIAALVVAVKEKRREEVLLLAPALALLAALFLVRLAPWAWDNTKVMLWCYLVALPPIGSLLIDRVRLGWRMAAMTGLLFSGAVSVAAVSFGRGPDLQILDLAEYAGVCRAVRALPLDARVATAPTFNHPVALCGQPIVAGYPGHLWSHGAGAEASSVLKGLERLFQGGPGWREEARTLEARYVFWGERERAAYRGSRRPWEETGPPVASGAWGALYRIE
jgi:hypothetical protein